MWVEQLYKNSFCPLLKMGCTQKGNKLLPKGQILSFQSISVIGGECKQEVKKVASLVKMTENLPSIFIHRKKNLVV